MDILSYEYFKLIFCIHSDFVIWIPFQGLIWPYFESNPYIYYKVDLSLKNYSIFCKVHLLGHILKKKEKKEKEKEKN